MMGGTPTMPEYAIPSGTMTAQTATPAKMSGSSHSRRYDGSQPRIGNNRGAMESERAELAIFGSSTVAVLFRCAFRWSRRRVEKTAYASQRELDAHGDDDQPHEPRRRVANKPAR